MNQRLSEIRDVMVHLDGTSGDEARIKHAESLALRFGAHLTGLYTNLIPAEVWAPTPEFSGALLLAELQQKGRVDSERVKDRLAERFRLLQVNGEVRKLDLFMMEMRDAIADQSRSSDLFVVTRPYSKDDRDSRWPNVFEAALFESGRSVYVVPPASEPRDAAASVLIAWNGSREATRAIAEGMPFLRRAEQVVVALTDVERPAEEAGEERGADLARHLSRHGIAAELRHIPEWHSQSAGLLNEIERLGSDLVIMGGYGHSRLRETVLGGMTRDFLTECPVPMLMAH
ncbi:nucleotide-binding universal stress UspA family protein [Rhodoligotrophos appendicifer]|uniref:universal stress protein n=1 Tax=Rhodoligotrophos appendicifer TaxID=987056 RepID=UPI001FEC3EC9|nr:universal stress protein [Rhodoligotrophos appendicifer]